MYVSNWEEPEWQKQQRIDRMNKATGGGQSYGNNNSNNSNSYNNNQQYNNHSQQNRPPQQNSGGGDSFSDNFGGSMDFDDVPL